MTDDGNDWPDSGRLWKLDFGDFLPFGLLRRTKTTMKEFFCFLFRHFKQVFNSTFSLRKGKVHELCWLGPRGVGTFGEDALEKANETKFLRANESVDVEMATGGWR